MKIIALDIGDVWTGSAISDALGITCKPYKTVSSNELFGFLEEIFRQEPISEGVIGCPTTMKGTDSDQTKKVKNCFVELEQKFPSITWKLWDERLSSKRAQHLQQVTTKKDKIHEHSIAAAFILQSYLDHKALHSSRS